YPPAESIKRGAYILADTNGDPDILIIASGSEVHIALEVKDLLEKKNIKTRVVNMASFELFEMQDEEYKKKVIPRCVKKIALEA
ncbi:MAG: transketolase, partial [Nitrososphaeria archaeon]|nr:transketolase [Nitrososphaeria archaeon]